VYMDEPSSFLAELNARCEIARSRRSAMMNSALSAYVPFQGKHDTAPDEASFGLASETKTLRTYRSTRSGGPSVSATAIEGIFPGELAVGMLFVFSVSVEKLEVMLVECENHANGYSICHESEDTSSDSGSFANDVLSVLTDDKRFELDGSVQGIMNEESESSNRIYSSSDFLLFKLPEKIILRAVVSNVSCESLGRSSDSRNLNVTIGRIALIGIDGVNLLCLGKTVATAESPLVEIEVSRKLHIQEAALKEYTSALSISLVEKNDHNFLHCDAPAIRFSPDFATLAELKSFLHSSPFIMPQKLLRPSPYDRLRVIILQQNVRVAWSFNCSIRIQGFEIELPVRALHESNEEAYDSSSSTDASTGARLILSCDLIELYSGTAVDDLTDCMHNVNANIDCAVSNPLSQKLQDRFGTRQLRMIDVPSIMTTKASPFANQMVRCVDVGRTLSHVLNERSVQ
jgi:hypothetical protein